MKVLYFAWLRERIGKAEEEITFPPGTRTVGEAMAHLALLGEEYAYAFENPSIIRIALDRRHVPHDCPLGTARELAFFPPMTGG
ncbi:MAG: molybdopterin converting factor subunit 1 [Methylobacterium sp.]|jgi:molybdopterin synthase sulfur carrier subunit|nr:molybdopterin converting factor subunit 1 [Methylobacterium sp.]